METEQGWSVLTELDSKGRQGITIEVFVLILFFYQMKTLCWEAEELEQKRMVGQSGMFF